MNKKRNIGIALVGYGYWGARLFRSLRSLAGVRIEAVCSRGLGRLLEHSDLPIVKSYQEAVRHDHVQAVVVATPPPTHYDIAAYALNRGKHVMVEKPMTTTSHHAKKLLDLSKQKGLVLLIDHTYLYARPVQKIRNIIAQGILGKIYCIDSTRTNLGRFTFDGDVLWDLGPHDLSICNYLLQQMPTQVAVFGGSHVVPGLLDKADMHLVYPSGANAHIHLAWISPIKDRRLIVVGRKKMLVYDDVGAQGKLKLYDRTIEIVRSKDTKKKHFYYINHGVSIIPVVGEEPLVQACSDFVSCIKTGKKPAVSGEDGKRVVEILEAATGSYRNHGTNMRISYDSFRRARHL